MNKYYLILKSVLGEINAELLLSSRADSVYRFAALLPDEFAYFLSGIEFDLTDKTGKADLLSSLSSRGKEPFALIKSFSESEEFKNLKKNPIWKKTGNVIDDWFENNYLKNNLENIWFEFDHEKMELLDFNPGVFFGIKEESNREKVIDFISYFDSVDENEKVFDMLFEDFGLNKNFSHFARFYSRDKRVLRLFFKNVDLDIILEIIKKLKPDNNTNNLYKIIKPLESYFDIFSLHLDVMNERILTQVGIEAYLKRSSLFIYKKRIALINEYLTDKKLAEKEKFQNLILNKKISLDEYINIAGWKTDQIDMGIHHYKFTFKNDEITSKIYYWFEGNWHS